MKGSFRILLLFLYLLSNRVLAQLPNLVPLKSGVFCSLDAIGIDLSSRNSMGLVPLFEVRNNWVHSYLDMAGADFSSVADSIKIVPPAHQGSLSYGYVFQFHDASKWEPKRLLFVVENGHFWHRKTISRIWFDRNHNLDFTDEDADTLYIGKARNPFWFYKNKPFASGVSMEVFPQNKFYRFSQMNDESIKLMAGPRSYLGTGNSLKIERINIRYTRVKFRQDTLSIGILDANSNGFFNDIGIDQWLISPGASNTLSTQYTLPIQANAEFAWMGHAFKLTLDSTQTETDYRIGISPVKKSNRKHKSILLGEKIPRFKYCTTDKKRRRKSSRKMGNKTTILVIWSADNKDFVKDSAVLHQICRSSADNVNWIFLNFGGSGKYVSYYNRRYDLNVVQGFCNSRIGAKLKLQHLPQYMVWDNRKSLIFNTYNVSELQDTIRNIQK